MIKVERVHRVMSSNSRTSRLDSGPELRRSERVYKKRQRNDDDDDYVEPPKKKPKLLVKKKRKNKLRVKLPKKGNSKSPRKTPRKRFEGWERNRIASNQKWRCNFCSTMFGPHWEIDHMVPLQFSGSNRYQNLQALCVDCHRFKTFYLDSFIIKPILKELNGSEFVVREEIEQIQRDHLFKMMCRDAPEDTSLLTKP